MCKESRLTAKITIEQFFDCYKTVIMLVQYMEVIVLICLLAMGRRRSVLRRLCLLQVRENCSNRLSGEKISQTQKCLCKKC